MKKVFFLLLVFAFLFSCAERKVATKGEEEVQPKEAEEVIIPAEKEEEIKAMEGGEVAEVSKEMEMISLDDVLKKDIHFDFDKYEIKSEDKATLKALADVMIKNSNSRIRIEGHCDERGTNEYNLGLGDKRANATKSYLMTLGVSGSRLLTISYGEERPLCTQSDEGCWWKNRRAHFTPAN